MSGNEVDLDSWDPNAHPTWCAPAHCTQGAHRGEPHQVGIGQGVASLRLLRTGEGQTRIAFVVARRERRVYVQLDAVAAQELSGVLGRLVERLRLDSVTGQVS